ncbi:MAG TPA: hypothetical protein VN922_20015 [Bacteroidia bacterium]|nr:hypothetical protein [Bacteroidia bacterium]
MRTKVWRQNEGLVKMKDGGMLKFLKERRIVILIYIENAFYYNTAAKYFSIVQRNRARLRGIFNYI